MSSEKIDIVIPVYRASVHLAETISELESISELINQIILIDDGSNDSFVETLKSDKIELCKHFNKVNLGQHPSTLIGLSLSKSKIVLTLDDDLPLSIVELKIFIEKAKDINAELCYASYFNGNWFRKLGSWITNLIALRRFDLRGKGSSTRLIQRSLILKLDLTDRNLRFIDNELLQIASSVTFIVVKANKSKNKSRYTFDKLISLFTSMILRK